MDDQLFQKWSETLSEIRQARQTAYAGLQREKGPLFSAKDFSEVATASLKETLDCWWEFESVSTGPKEDVVAEMESVVDFELESIERDLAGLRGLTSWNDKKVEEEVARIHDFSDGLKRTFHSKLSLKTSSPSDLGSVFQETPAFAPPFEPGPLPEFAPLPPSPAQGPQTSIPSRSTVARPLRPVGRSSGSGVAMFLMLILGLLIGSGPSFYFWDNARKSDSSSQDKLSQVMSEKRALEDNLAIFQQNYSKLAQGKMKNIPQLEEAMKPIRDSIGTRRRNIEMDFYDKRESVMKKIPSGDRQDRTIKKLKDIREESLAALDVEQKTRLEPYLKELQVLKELMGQ